MRGRIISAVVAVLLGTLASGCRDVVSLLPNATWHQKFKWDAKDYFNDPKVIELCHAIEANDIPEIDRLVAAGADVNAIGKHNMTPLLWALPDNKLDRFTRLLELGANPNVNTRSDFGTRGLIDRGKAVTHLATAIAFSGYFEAVFSHGGDPNLEIDFGFEKGDTPIFTLISLGSGDKKEKLRLLISKGANINHISESGITPAMQAVAWGLQFDLALMLLKAGADPRIYCTNDNQRLVHLVMAKGRREASWPVQLRAEYQSLVEWLEAHGESLEEARKDDARWGSWNKRNGEYRRKMNEEIAARKAKEAGEQRKTVEPVNDTK